MNRPWIAAAAALLLATPAVQADIGQGDIEAGISVSLTQTTIESDDLGFEQDFDSGSIEVNGGYFYTDQLEIKLAVSMFLDSETTSGTINPGADFLFGGTEFAISDLKGDLVPFVGASYGKAVGDFDDTDFLEGHGGFKYFFRERTSLELKLGYSQPLDTEFSATTNLLVGVNVYF